MYMEFEQLREHSRKVEQKNDDLERSNRVVAATVTDLEAMLNQAYEKNEFLELEVEDKECLSVKHQRVLDELRGKFILNSYKLYIKRSFISCISFRIIDLKQEMKVKTVNTSESPIRKLTVSSNASDIELTNKFEIFYTDSESILNGNTPPIASQKAFNIIADSLRRIDVSLVV